MCVWKCFSIFCMLCLTNACWDRLRHPQPWTGLLGIENGLMDGYINFPLVKEVWFAFKCNAVVFIYNHSFSLPAHARSQASSGWKKEKHPGQLVFGVNKKKHLIGIYLSAPNSAFTSFEEYIFVCGERGLTPIVRKETKESWCAWITLLFSGLLFWQTHYGDGEYIIRQGARGDTFFIISKGKVRTVPLACHRNNPHDIATQGTVARVAKDAYLWSKVVVFLGGRWQSPIMLRSGRGHLCHHLLQMLWEHQERRTESLSFHLSVINAGFHTERRWHAVPSSINTVGGLSCACIVNVFWCSYSSSSFSPCSSSSSSLSFPRCSFHCSCLSSTTALLHHPYVHLLTA